MENLCPDCGEPLVLRENRATGEQFYGCSAYPECRYTKKLLDEEDQGWDEREEQMRMEDL